VPGTQQGGTRREEIRAFYVVIRYEYYNKTARWLSATVERKKITSNCSCPDKSESLGFPLIGMKFDDVTQWVTAYDKIHIPLCRACSGTGENGANVIQLIAELALALRNEA
jgi:hypothetical protein